MSNHTDHRSDEVNAVPRRGKDVHTPQFDDSVHASSCRQEASALLSLRIGHGETQGLHVAVEPRKPARASRLTSRTVRVFPESAAECPTRCPRESSNPGPVGKIALLRDVFQQPGGASLAYCCRQGSLDRLPRMSRFSVSNAARRACTKSSRQNGRPFFRERELEGRNRPADQTARRPARCAGTTPPAAWRLHQEAASIAATEILGPKTASRAQCGKGKRPNVRYGFLAAPNHCAIDRSCHRSMQVQALVIEDAAGESAWSEYVRCRFGPVSHQVMGQVAKSAGNAHQAGVAAQQAHRSSREAAGSRCCRQASGRPRRQG